MARLIHVASSLVSPNPAAPQASDTDTGTRVNRPRSLDVVTPWFQLSAAAPNVDSRVSPGVGVSVVATLRAFGAMLGPEGRSGPASEGPQSREIVLGGNPSSAGAPPPLQTRDFARGCSVGVSLHASGVPPQAQCLLLFGLRGLGPDERATVDVFAGVVPVGVANIVGDDQLPLLVDVPNAASAVGFEVWLRLTGDPASAALGVRGVAGFLL